MDGSTIPARRACVLYFHATAVDVVTDAGWELMERFVLWALGLLEAAADPKGALTVKWGALKAYFIRVHARFAVLRGASNTNDYDSIQGDRR